MDAWLDSILSWRTKKGCSEKMKTSHFILAIGALETLMLKIVLDAEIEMQRINAKRGLNVE